eukprot:12263226-Heterocapsa_arctica.AAC.1
MLSSQSDWRDTQRCARLPLMISSGCAKKVPRLGRGEHGTVVRIFCSALNAGKLRNVAAWPRLGTPSAVRI